MDRSNDTHEKFSDGLGRRLNWWSHDVLVAMVLTVLAIGFIGLTWVNSGARQTPSLGASTIVTTK